MVDKQEKISLRLPTYEAYVSLYDTRFNDEVVYWADSFKQNLSSDEYATGRLYWTDKQHFYERIIYIDEQPIGTVTAREIDWDRAICTLGVVIAVPAYWGRGYGPRALKQFFVLIAEMGIKYVVLQTFSNNTRARKCFSRLGFRKRRSFYAPDTGRFVIEMILKLEPNKAIGYVVKGGSTR